jgi:hypothetical protein
VSRPVTPEFLAAVLGSNSPIVTLDIVVGGEVIREGLTPVSGGLDFDSTRDVESTLTVAVVDDESRGSKLSEVIHSVGTQVNVKAGFDLAGVVETVSMGWFDVENTDTDVEWLTVDWAPAPIKGRSLVTIDGLDLMSVVAKSDFLVPTQPVPGADAWGTIAGLCAGIVSVLDPQFVAKTIPATGLTFEWSRLGAIKAIAKLWDAVPVMTELGQLTLVTDASGDVIPSFGMNINIAGWKDLTSSADLHNGVTFIGKDVNDAQLIGIATEQAGLARWDGPFGRRPLQASSDLMTTQGMVDAAARTRLATEIAGRAVVQTVDALWNPSIELRDKPQLVLPDQTVTSRVLGYSLPLTGGAMQVTLRRPMVL